MGKHVKQISSLQPVTPRKKKRKKQKPWTSSDMYKWRKAK